MKEVNNFDVIIPYLNFDNSIHLVWLVQRNKDGNSCGNKDNKNRTIKSYYFQSLQKLQEKKEEIINLCKQNNCRAYICMNAKPIIKVLFTLQGIIMDRLQEQLKSNSYLSLHGILDSAVMKSGSNGNKLWIVDIDTDDMLYMNEIAAYINSQRSGFTTNTITYFKTLNGFHLITHPFDCSHLKEIYPDIEIKKEGLTLLYAYVL